MGFDQNRNLQFDPDRDLDFDLNRDLSFDPNRDLGFGRRGILFRGYVCSACGAIVNPLSEECNECGAVFVSRKRKTAQRVKPELKYCIYCGHPVTKTDVYCRNCGLKVPGSHATPRGSTRTEQAMGGYESLKLSEKKGKKVLTDWSETGRDFEEFVEK